MTGAGYSAMIRISAVPDSVYNAITKQVDKWWTESANQAWRVGDELIVGFENATSWVMTVSEAVPGRSLVWKVMEAHHNLEGMSKKDEWKGTTVNWHIEGEQTDSLLTLVHEGLVPAPQCYSVCESGWLHFLGSLKNYLETGVGNPYRIGFAD